MYGIIQNVLKKAGVLAEDNVAKANGVQNEAPSPEGQSNVTEASGQSQAPAEKYPGKPSGMDDDKYEWLINYGIKPQAISNVFNPDYNPTTDGDYLTRLAQLFKPEGIDEKKMERKQTAASISDALGTLVQMFAAGRGAHIKERDASQSAMSRFLKEERELRDLYRAQRDKYNERLFSASASDYNRSYAQNQADIKDIRDALHRKMEFDHRAGQEAITRQQQEERFKLQKDEFEETMRRNRAAESMQQSVQAARRAGGVQKSSGEYKPIQVDANPSDTNAYTDPFGRRKTRLTFSKDEYEFLLSEARKKVVSEPEWADKHPGVLLEKPQITGIGIDRKMTGSYKFNDLALVEAYVKELYDALFSAKGTFPMGTEDVLKNPGLPVEKKIEWLKSNHNLSDMEVMDVLNERGLLSGNVTGRRAGIDANGSAKDKNTGDEGKKRGKQLEDF
jgi:hypothetical protein